MKNRALSAAVVVLAPWCIGTNLCRAAAGTPAAAEAAPAPALYGSVEPSGQTMLPPATQIGPVQVLPVAPGIEMLTVNGVNIVVQSGPDGIVVVNPGPAQSAPAVLTAIARISSEPIHYLIDTGADPELVGGNAALAAAGRNVAVQDVFIAGQRRGFTNLITVPGANGGGGAPIIARQNVLTEMAGQTEANYSGAAFPTDTFTRPAFNLFINEPIAVLRLPGAHSDADAAVRFERSNVVVAGEIFDQTRFPIIELQHGGSAQGEIDALNLLINMLTFAHTPVLTDDPGTLVIPVHGPLGTLDDLVTYRDMVATVMMRVQYYIDHGRNYQQILSADPAQGFHTRYGSDRSWTAADFVQAVYKSVMAGQQARHRQRG
jgi:glyoxylase-like metal-dependent hydrolase (beta-lactamase superfamily II)